VLAANALQLALVFAVDAFEYAPMLAVHAFEFAAVLPVYTLQRTVMIATQPFQLAPQFVAHARDLGFRGLAGLRRGSGFRPDPVQVRLEGRHSTRRLRRQPLTLGVELLLRPRTLRVAFHFRGIACRGDRLINPLLRAGLQIPAQLLFRGLPFERRGFPRTLFSLRLRGGDRLLQALVELVAQPLLRSLVLERRGIPALDLSSAARRGDFVLQPLFELLTDPLFGRLALVLEFLADALLGCLTLLLEFLSDPLFGSLPLASRRVASPLFPLRLSRRHGLRQLPLELLPQLVLEGLPVRGRRGTTALLAVGARLGDQVRDVRLHLFLDLRDARFRRALRLEQGLLTRFRDLSFVLLLEGGELLVERPSQLRLQIVKGHRG
jgi:hypothetical protein